MKKETNPFLYQTNKTKTGTPKPMNTYASEIHEITTRPKKP
jgi:hypothetical protein